MGEQSKRCPSCGTEPRAGARFCDGCGAQLVPQVAEYKQVTVLFADVTHSMDIAAEVGPERLREIMSELMDRSTTVIRRYGGTVDKFIGDGVMALFGAPVALEDHAVRACLAAMDIQAEAHRLGDSFTASDGIDFKVRVGLNSGEVIAGEIGSSPMAYTVIGEQVGLAQRMESAAPPGGVMLSATTARLVEHAMRLSDRQWVRIKGAEQPVPAYRLLAIVDRHGSPPSQADLIGRETEIGEVTCALDRAIAGNGGVLAVSGPPGIGKSRIAREIAATASRRGVDVFWAYCQSHTRDVPFRAATELMRSVFGVAGQSPERARAGIRSALVGADPQDLLLLDDLLEIGDGLAPVGDIDPDARRRRLITLLDSALLARREPAVYVIEDAHWIDPVSEAMLTEFVAAVPRAAALVLVTHRPEYVGPLVAAAAPIRLAPLGDAESTALTERLVGTDASVAAITRRIADRAAGNPFFIEEMVRDLAERDVLRGARGAYTCSGTADVAVPATVQAAIAARIDRLGAAAKQSLSAAAVIGSPFSRDLLCAVVDDVALAELTAAELIAQVDADPVRYAFRHPLMQAVAYESQLRSGRARLHRAIAAAIERAATDGTDAEAAVIANHLEAAGDLADAFGWHMRAGTWSTHRDIAAARVSWLRAAAVADRLAPDVPGRSAMRIAPRTLLAATIWRVGGEIEDVGFNELRALTTEAGDKRSLAIAMAGLVQMLNFHGRYAEASWLASEQVHLLDAIADPELSVALIPTVASIAKWDAGEMSDALYLAQRGIDESGGDPTMGNLIVGCPLAMALVMRASTRCCLGIAGWREDFDEALRIARTVDKFTYSTVVMFKYIAIMNWALTPDEQALRDTEEALHIARQFGDNFLLTNAEFTYGFVLVRRTDTDRELGFQLLTRSRQVALEHRYTIIAAWCVDLEFATEAIRTGDFDTAVELSRRVVDEEIHRGEGINRGWSTSVLVEALLGRRRDGDLAEARAAIDRLAATPTEPVFLYHELPLLRLEALMAMASGDEDGYAAFKDRYRARAAETGFDGHIELVRSMP
ncbi:AAA family ATPase [Mycobacterium sp. Y57]|uniref:ATP-binding protein n=1 Tax=Mycolicibacterium xanthum TaxID=2796469 RepID=UPI001C844217|nr:adenylate/guanylate cyclase domain-containing protein [Mycolicibacterium xanthum]MBX7434044.1 AAA family ATPase [Mycolicibacterium xanthum]